MTKILPFTPKREEPEPNASRVTDYTPEYVRPVDSRERFYDWNPETGAFDREINPHTGEPIERED